MKARLTYANVTATLALVFAMSGGAIAAKHYLLSSTSQIKPSVLKKLRGATGVAGTPGAPGGPGREGPQGKQGEAGKTGERGPSEAFAAQAPAVAFPSGANAAEVVAQVKLGAGNYALVGTVNPHNEAASAGEAECVLLEQPLAAGETAVFDEATTPLEAKAKTGARRSLALSATRVVTAEADVSIACKTPSTEGKYEAAHLTATRVATLG